MYYDSVEITGEAVDWYKKRKNAKEPTEERREFLTLKMDRFFESEQLDKLLEVLQDITEGEYVEFTVKSKTTNG